MDLATYLKEQAINDLKNLFPEAIGAGQIIPQQAQYPYTDNDLEVAELLAKELTEIGVLYTAAEMQKIRRFIQHKRLTTMVGINEKTD